MCISNRRRGVPPNETFMRSEWPKGKVYSKCYEKFKETSLPGEICIQHVCSHLNQKNIKVFPVNLIPVVTSTIIVSS